ncbi:MAG: TRAM domain-containing protein [Pseudomonadota bacterium]
MSRRRGRSRQGPSKHDPAIGREIDLTIDEIGSSGDGVGRFDGGPVYVPLALPGDDLTARLITKRGDGYAAETIKAHSLTPRRQPLCRHFGACGGCRLQHLSPIDYRQWKSQKVKSALARRGIDGVGIKPLIDGHPETRRRLRLAFSPRARGSALGLRRRLDNDIVAVEECPIALPLIVQLLAPFRLALPILDLAAKGGQISITAADNGLDILIETPLPPSLGDREALAALADEEDLARLTWRESTHELPEPLSVRRQPEVDFGGVSVALPAAAFLQATDEAERAIRDSIIKALGSAEMVADLFSGCGAFGLPLALEERRVHAVDHDPGMIEALNGAASAASLAQRVTAIARDLDRDPLSASELSTFDAAILDPPRAGAHSQVEAIAEGQGPLVLAMVSCNPTTFARDARTLIDAGYHLDWVQPIDAFLFAADVELVAAFKRTIAS